MQPIPNSREVQSDNGYETSEADSPESPWAEFFGRAPNEVCASDIKPKVTLEDGLKETVNDFKKLLDK